MFSQNAKTLKLVDASWTKTQLENTLVEKGTLGTSVHKLQAKYNIPIATLHRYIKKRENTELFVESRGRKPVLTKEAKKELKDVIPDLASLGFAPTLSGVTDLVKQYVIENDVTAANKVFNYNDVVGCPGPDWLSKFLKDEGLSLKDATKLSKERHNATRNPFIIYRFYDLLGKVVEDLLLDNRPDLIWNCDETGMPHEPKKCKVISVKGEKTLQVVPGCDWENTTVLAACSASGKVLPPLIIHPGQQVQLAWRPNITGTDRYPWQHANPSGWMMTDIFYKWFQLFEEWTRTVNEDGEIEPCLMIYDGHLSHVGLDTLRYARNFNITIVKLPPHTADLLQPLDVAVFSSLKIHWGKIMFQRLKSVHSKLSKSEFAKLLSSGGMGFIV